MSYNLKLPVTTGQRAGVEPEPFQTQLIANLSRALLRTPAPPCLLRAPTGSGKTFVITKVLEAVGAKRPTLWLWFVPFATLVTQTIDALTSNGLGLAAGPLATARNEECRAGQVLVSTAQAVARAVLRNSGYNADADDQTRSLNALVARAKAQGLRIGLVVDEAHIGLAHGTEFGRFAHWLAPEFLLMATATPRDERISEFLSAAGMSARESFSVSRAEVVEARLNKRYIEAVVYQPQASMQLLTDLKRTVLQQAWLRNQKLKQQLAQAGIALTPLLLVQVANGEKTVEEAEKVLLELCKVPPAAIGKHSSDEPNPVLMAAIANDATKEVLIFKQSAGTGFDAPRAFVLASTKVVNDSDFAMQFIGRVMRVAPAIRTAFAPLKAIAADFDCAYVYLADASAQAGFQAAVDALSAVQNQLEGQTEKLVQRQTASGAMVFTNRVTPQMPVGYDWALPEPESYDLPAPPAAQSLLELALQPSLFETVPATVKLDEVIQPTSPARPALPRTRAALLGHLTAQGIRSYPLKTGLRNLPLALKTEQQPEVGDLAEISRIAATRLPLSEALQKTAVQVALNRRKQEAVHTELTTHQQHFEQVRVVTNRNALAAEARRVVHELLSAEDDDLRILVTVLAARLMPALAEVFEDADEAQKPDALTLARQARDAAHWVICQEAEALLELMQSLVAEQTRLTDAAPLPELMLFPAALPLTPSRKNIYGVLPPSAEDLAQLNGLLLQDERRLLLDKPISLDDGSLSLASFASGGRINKEERAFAAALDQAPFVEWWHRNADRKPYAVRLVRGEHSNYFYPDFVVCLCHTDLAEPVARLVETKHDTKDASRKARRPPRHYGKVLFLTRDQSLLRVVNDDGSLGARVNLDDLAQLREWMRGSAPMHG